MQRSVAGQPRRPRVARDLVSNRVGPGAHDLRSCPRPGRSARARAERRRRSGPASSRALRASPRRAAPAPTGRADAPVAVISVWPGPASRSASAARLPLVELGEDVVEQEKRRRGATLGQERRFGEDQREHGEALLALRAEAAQVTVVRRGSRRRPGAARDRSFRGRDRRRGAPRALRPSAGRPRSAAHRPGGPSSTARSANSGASSAIASRRASTSSRAQLCDPLGPRRDGVSRRGADRDAPERGVPLRHGRAVLGRDAGPRRKQPPQRTVEVRAPRGRPALDHDEAVRREDERRRPRSGAARPRAAAAPFSRAFFASPGRSVTSISSFEPPRSPASSIRAASAPKRTSWASLRLRGEKPCVPTWSASSRFVLPAPFRPTASTSPGDSSSSSDA